MFGLGTGEILIILFIILLLFGAKKLPELAKGLGKGVNEFKKASSEIKEEVNKAIESKEDK
jgi:sec-independent protein translocase protein TatA